VPAHRLAACRVLVGAVAAAAIVTTAWRGLGEPASVAGSWTSAACLAAGLAYLLAWRTSGLARPAWLASSLLVLAGVASSGAASADAPAGSARIGLLVGAVVAAGAVAVVYALQARPWALVDTRATPARLIGAALGASVVGGALAPAAGAITGWWFGSVHVPAPPAGILAGLDAVGALAATVLALGAGRELARVLTASRRAAFVAVVDATEANRELLMVGADREERDHALRSAVFAMDCMLRAMSLSGGSGAADPAAGVGQLAPGGAADLAASLAQQVSVARSLLAPERREAADEVADVVRAEVVAERAIGTDVDLEVRGRTRAFGSPAWTAEILRTLLDNARSYAAGARVRVVVEATGEELFVRVRDDGPGVPADQRRRIFERGWRGRPDVPGSGLGLFVAAELARRQGGELVLESVPRGASFMLRLPAADVTVGADAAIRSPADDEDLRASSPAGVPSLCELEPETTGAPR
jgi:signal transduction histidine kinase